MEGVSHEACSLAGTWGLGKLIAFYDDNGISIDGHVEGWFTDQTAMRFRAYMDSTSLKASTATIRCQSSAQSMRRVPNATGRR